MKSKATKLLIHLKNIIFFKCVLFTFIIIGLLMFISNSYNMLSKQEKQQNKAHILLKEAKYKLDILENLDNKTKESNNVTNICSCHSQEEFLEYISNLHKKYQLQDPIHYTVSQAYNEPHDMLDAKNFAIKYRIIDLEFKIFDRKQLLSITQDLNQNLPKGAIVIRQTANKSDTITPTISKQLEQNSTTPLVNITMKIMLRNVARKPNHI